MEIAAYFWMEPATQKPTDNLASMHLQNSKLVIIGDKFCFDVSDVVID